MSMNNTINRFQRIIQVFWESPELALYEKIGDFQKGDLIFSECVSKMA